MLSSANLVVAARAVDRDSFQGLTLTAAATNEGTFQVGDVCAIPVLRLSILHFFFFFSLSLFFFFRGNYYRHFP